MGVLGIFVPVRVNGAEASEKKLTYVGIQGLLENVAMGIEEKQAEEERRAQAEEPTNCTMIVSEPVNLAVKKEGIPGLQIMEVFTLCGLLAALGWGGVTSILVVMAKAWTTKPPSQGADVSTSRGELTAGSRVRPFKPGTLSFRDEWARWEWPRRTVPLARRARRAHVWGIPEGQAGWGECSQRDGSGTASLPRRMEDV
jgi:hypothetical protein